MFLTFYKEAVECGFPSPARDFTEGTIDLNEELIPHPNATFIVRARGDSMIGSGIYPGDLLIVDRSIKPRNNSIIIAIPGRKSMNTAGMRMNQREIFRLLIQNIITKKARPASS